MDLKHLRHITCGDWQLKTRLGKPLQSTPVISVLMRYIINSHNEDSLVCVIRDWKPSWTVWLVCFNYYRAEQPIISLTQVFHIVSVILVIETWDGDGASSLDWHLTDSNDFAVNSCQNNSRHLFCSGAFKYIMFININCYICYRLVSWILSTHNMDNLKLVASCLFKCKTQIWSINSNISVPTIFFFITNLTIIYA